MHAYTHCTSTQLTYNNQKTTTTTSAHTSISSSSSSSSSLISEALGVWSHRKPVLTLRECSGSSFSGAGLTGATFASVREGLDSCITGGRFTLSFSSELVRAIFRDGDCIRCRRNIPIKETKKKRTQIQKRQTDRQRQGERNHNKLKKRLLPTKNKQKNPSSNTQSPPHQRKKKTYKPFWFIVILPQRVLLLLYSGCGFFNQDNHSKSTGLLNKYSGIQRMDSHVYLISGIITGMDRRLGWIWQTLWDNLE